LQQPLEIGVDGLLLRAEGVDPLDSAKGVAVGSYLGDEWTCSTAAASFVRRSSGSRTL